MRFFGVSKYGLYLAAGVLAFVATPRASATAELTLNDGLGHIATVNGVSCGGTCVQATFNGSLGNWNINVTTGTADPAGAPIIDLNSIDHHNAGPASTLTIMWSDTDLTPAASGFQLNIGGTLGAHGTLTAALYGANSNTINDTSHQIGSTLSFTSPPTAFSGSESAFLGSLSPSPYSLTEVTTLSFGSSAGQASYDYSVDTIPEPAGVLLLGSAMLLTVSVVRRKVGKRA